ncbi:MAG: DivIVA domain-containing protein [Armatimonadota bacterium]|nr:DivIVA domain-containing protein [bacterium]
MPITPIDILHTEFKPAFRGYDKAQVDEFARAVREALEQALGEKSELARQVESLQDEVDRVRRIETAMTDALTMAQKSADEAKANAHKQAELILKEAENSRITMMVETQKEVEKNRVDAELIQATRDRFETEFRGMLKAYLEWLDRRGSESEEKSASEVA